MIARLSTLLLLVAGLCAGSVAAFELDPRGLKWPGARTTIYTGIPGTSRSGIPWAQAIRDAATEWNVETAFSFDMHPGYRNPCARGTRPGFTDNLNGMDFTPNVCGDAYTSGTLAVALIYSEFNQLGAVDIVETDIVFNSNVRFDVYDGPLRPGLFGLAEVDFRRVALHELGHVLGLQHSRTQAAIMAPNIGALFRLQADDIAGANTLYSGVANCDNRHIGFGWVFGRLESGDCRIRELMVGGNDNSFVDVYKFELADALQLTVDMTGAGGLDGALLLTGRQLNILRVDENSGGNCNPRISINLPAGQYALLANTYSSAPPCGTTTVGDYRLRLSYVSDKLLTLTGRQSFQGGESQAVFSGGVTTNGGQSYSNRVGPNQPFDVRGRIGIPPEHQGQPGYLVAAALLDGDELLVLNSVGDFVPYQPEIRLVPIFRSKVLDAVEEFMLLQNFVASRIGISQVQVDFLIGYGLDSQPDELYFHEQPINLIIE